MTPKFNNKKYKVVITLNENLSNTVFVQDATILRSLVKIAATYTVHLEGKQIYEGSAEASSSYSQLPAEEFATKNAEIGARERTITVLAEELSLEILRVIRNK